MESTSYGAAEVELRLFSEGGLWGGLVNKEVHQRGPISFFSVNNVIFTKWRNRCLLIWFDEMLTYVFSTSCVVQFQYF